jgi:hypothetical protein
MITPGALVLCKQTGRQLFVAVRQTDDITVVKAAPAYKPGDEIEHSNSDAGAAN